MLNTNTVPRKLIKWPIVHVRTGKSRTQAWRDIRTGRFPAPIQNGPNSVAWFEDEVDAWLSDRPRVSYAPKSTAPERNTTEPLQSAVTEKRSVPVGVASKSRKTRAPAERSPKKRCEPVTEGAEVVQITDPMLRGARTNADVIVQHFIAERQRLWPDASSADVPTDKLCSEADAALKSGTTVSVMIQTLTRQMEAAAEMDRPAPISMRSVTSGTPFAAAREGAKATHS